MLHGEKTVLRPFEIEDVPLVQRWFADPEVRRWWDGRDWARSRAELERVLGPQILGEDAGTKWFVICEDGRPVGALHYHPDVHNRTADVDILIGEPEARGRGLGTDAILTLLAFLFDELAMHRVEISGYADNERAVRCYEKCGFVREGVFREGEFHEGRWRDLVLMSMLEDEWRSRR